MVAVATSKPSIAVVYLARSSLASEADFRQFITSYRRFEPGVAHELIVLRKGFDEKPDLQAALAALLDGVPHQAIDITDDGFDIQAYVKVAGQLNHELICCLNTFSVIRANNWLKMLAVQLDELVGMVAATASYESLYDSTLLISKAYWLTATKDIEFDLEIASQFESMLMQHVPQWLAKRGRSSLLKQIAREVARLLPRKINTEEINSEFAAYWDELTCPGAVLSHIRDFRRFPNPHLRTNGFIMRRHILVGLAFALDNSKAASLRFESGLDGLPARLAREGLGLVLVGADGVGYAVADWPKSRTFRLGIQENVLIVDNQVRAFNSMSNGERALYTRITWGDYAPQSAAKIVDLGIKFQRGSLDLSSPARADRMPDFAGGDGRQATGSRS